MIVGKYIVGRGPVLYNSLYCSVQYMIVVKYTVGRGPVLYNSLYCSVHYMIVVQYTVGRGPTCLFTRLDRVHPGPSRVSDSPVSAENVIY